MIVFGFFIILMGGIVVLFAVVQIVKAIKVLFTGAKLYLMGSKITFAIYKKLFGVNSPKFNKMETQYYKRNMKLLSIVILCTFPMGVFGGLLLIYLGVTFFIG